MLCGAFDDPDNIARELAGVGACSVPVLGEPERERLLAEARGYAYRPRQEVAGKVRQQLATFDDFSPDSAFLVLRDELRDALDASFAELPRYPFDTPLSFDELVLQKYDPGSIGITPHRDRSAYINLVCVVTLAGRARFYVASDRAATDPVSIDASPGTAILMRAPGFHPARPRPFHAVDRVEGPRFVAAMRQRAEGPARAARQR